MDSIQIDNAGAGTGINVVARATPPTSPIRPKPRTDGLVALGAGLLLGLVLAFFVEYLKRSGGSSESREMVPQAVAAEVALMGVLPTGNPSVNEVVSLSAPDSAAAQSYRSLHNAASFMGLERGRCIAVTSAPDRDGKTETLANLAVLLARGGRRVIVVDCDLRKPRVHSFFGLANGTGFTSVVRGAPLAEALQRVPNVDHLYALTSGPLPADPDDMLASDRCRDILSSLLVGGTLVLLDTPPMLPVTDAVTLAKTAPVDAIILVATAQTDAREHLRQALDALHQSGAPQVGVVLTTAEFGGQRPQRGGPSWSRRAPPPPGREPRRRDGGGAGSRGPPPPGPATFLAPPAPAVSRSRSSRTLRSGSRGRGGQARPKPPRPQAGVFERVTGIEPASPAWKAGALAIELHPRKRVKIPAGASLSGRGDLNPRP